MARFEIRLKVTNWSATIYWVGWFELFSFNLCGSINCGKKVFHYWSQQNSGYYSSAKTYLYDFTKNILKDGPPMKQMRSKHGCGRIQRSGWSLERSIIVAGGATSSSSYTSYTASVEILDGTAAAAAGSSWRWASIYLMALDHSIGL